MKIYIDTEFNEFKGDLISMALVAEDGSEFYEVLECENPGPWVAKNVMPILNKEFISSHTFKLKLHQFLNQFYSIELIADWPDDIKYFCEQIIMSPGIMMNIHPEISFHLRRDLSASSSKVPHNALEDAKAIYESYIESTLK